MRPHAGTLWRKPREHPPLSRKTIQPEPESQPTIEKARTIKTVKASQSNPKQSVTPNQTKQKTGPQTTAQPIENQSKPQHNHSRIKQSTKRTTKRKPSNSTTNPTQPIENKAPNQTNPIQKSKQSNRLFNLTIQSISQTNKSQSNQLSHRRVEWDEFAFCGDLGVSKR